MTMYVTSPELSVHLAVKGADAHAVTSAICLRMRGKTPVIEVHSKTRHGDDTAVVINFRLLKWVSVTPEDPTDWDDTNRPVVEIDWVDLNEL
jgi:hypothetical protein